MRMDKRSLYMACPPDQALGLLDSLRWAVRNGEDFKPLADGGLSSSKVQAIAAIFRSESSYHTLKKRIDDLVKKVQDTQNQARKDADNAVKALWNALHAEATKREEYVKDSFTGTGLDGNDVRFFLLQEAFQTFLKIFRYREACREWATKGEPPCSMS